MKKTEHITRDKSILGGKPIISGTRMSVEVILEFLAGGMEVRDMLKEFPFLKRKQIEAAIRYAAVQVGNKKQVLGRSADSSSIASLHEIHR